MMNSLRTAKNHFAFKIILTLIILPFIFSGAGNYFIDDLDDYIAKVNGQIITRAQLEQVFQSELRRLKKKLGEKFSVLASEESYMQQMRQKILSTLIDKMLLSQYAKKLDLIVSNEQVKNTIYKLPYLQTDGQFDQDKYLNLLRSMGYTSSDFAQSIYQWLINQQVIQAFVESDFALPSESQAIAALLFQERKVRLATIYLSALQAQQNVSDEEIKSYYQQNPLDFIEAEKVKVNYISIDSFSIQDKVKVSETEISAYYERHKSNYRKPEKKNYSIIQLKTETEANEVLNELKKGGDFTNLAKKKFINTTSRRTGSASDWLKKKIKTNELQQAHLTKKGQFSSVIKSSIGYLIVRLDNIEPEKIKPLSAIYERISKQVQKEKALNAYYVLRQKMSEAANSDNESLASIEEATSVKAVQTGWFTRDSIPSELNFKQVIQSIFASKLIDENIATGSDSGMITVGDNRAFVIKVTAHKEQGIKSFDEVKDRVAEKVRHSKALKKAKLQGEQLLVALNQGKGDKIMKAAGLSFGSVQKMVRVVEDDSLVENVFTLPHPKIDKPLYSISQDRQDNVVLIELDMVKEGSVSVDEMKKLVRKMEQSTASRTFYALLENLRKKAKINMRDVA